MAKYAFALATPWSLQRTDLRMSYVQRFIHTMGDISRWEWEYVPEGGLLTVTDDGAEIIADHEYVRLWAYD